MDRLILVGKNSDFPRASSAVTNSGTSPDSAAGGTRHPVETHAPKGAGRPPSARRPRATLGSAMAAVALWDTGRFRTDEIADALKLHEAEVCDILHYIREERRARA